jgi:hypothetical protein
MPSPELNSFAMLFAASSVFSLFGLIYFGVPILVLLTSAICLSTRTCRTFWLLVSGAVSAIVAIFIVTAYYENRGSELSDGQPALLANISVCVGAVIGVACFRIGHELVRRIETHSGRPKH